MRSNGRSRLLWLGIVLALLGALGWRSYRDWNQQRLDRALIAAVRANDANRAAALLARGANADARDTPRAPRSLWSLLSGLLHGVHTQERQYPTALRVVVSYTFGPHQPPWLPENVALIKTLLAHGADPEAPMHRVNGQIFIPYADLPPAALAAGQGKRATVQLLLDHSPAPRRQQEAQQAFLAAAQTGHVDIMTDMLGRGADINAGWQTENTALFYAINFERDTVVQTLLERGADAKTPKPTYSTFIGRGGVMKQKPFYYASYLHYALESQKVHPKDAEATRIVALLKKAGAK